MTRKAKLEVEEELNHFDKIFLWSFISYEVSTFIVLIGFPSKLSWGEFFIPFWLSSIGIAIGILSLLLFLWVHFSLGSFFSYKIQIVKNQELVKTGPYRYVRHPMYSAFIVLHISVILITHNWFIAFTWFGGLIVFLISRIIKEERVLKERFGDEYQEYMQNTGRIFPKIFKN